MHVVGGGSFLLPSYETMCVCMEQSAGHATSHSKCMLRLQGGTECVVAFLFHCNILALDMSKTCARNNRRRNRHFDVLTSKYWVAHTFVQPMVRPIDQPLTTTFSSINDTQFWVRCEPH